MTNQNHSGLGDNYHIEGDATFNSIQKHPSILADIVNELGNKLFNPSRNDSASYKEFDIVEKIKYNNIVKYKAVIEELKVYQGKLNSIYQELDDQGSDKKIKLLQNIRTLYLKAKGDYKIKFPDLSEQEIICNNSDIIIENIEKQLMVEIDKSNNIRANIEDIKSGILIVMVDAFIRCKILEEPK